MRDPDRIPAVLAHVETLWRTHPDWRLGQLISNLAAWADPNRDCIWDIEDDVLVAEIERHLEQQTRTGEQGPAARSIGPVDTDQAVAS